MPSYNTDAIVLRRLDFGESDRIITLFSRDLGKIGAIAKGARKPTSRFSGVTEVMTLAHCQLATGKSLDVVSQCEIQNGFPGLRHDLSRLAHGLYFVDLMDHATVERHPNPDLFDLLGNALEALETAASPALLARWYEVRLLDDLGYTPDTASCAVCQREVPGEFADDLVFALSISLGGAICPDDLRWDINSDHAVLGRRALALLENLIEMREVGDALSLTPSGRDLREVGAALRPYLRYRLERDLKSLEFLDSVTGKSDAPSPD